MGLVKVYGQVLRLGGGQAGENKKDNMKYTPTPLIKTEFIL